MRPRLAAVVDERGQISHTVRFLPQVNRQGFCVGPSLQQYTRLQILYGFNGNDWSVLWVCWPAYYFSSAQEMNRFDVAVCLVVQLAIFVELCKTEDCFCRLC